MSGYILIAAALASAMPQEGEHVSDAVCGYALDGAQNIADPIRYKEVYYGRVEVRIQALGLTETQARGARDMCAVYIRGAMREAGFLVRSLDAMSNRTTTR